MNKRSSGILLHITSLPSIGGVGTMGKNAFQFVDFLVETGQKLWQLLPLGPVGAGNSPYQCFSAFAGNTMLIDLELLIEDELLNAEELRPVPKFFKRKVEFERVGKWKNGLFKNAFSTFQNKRFNNFQNEYNHFLNEHGWWLDDYALFMAANDYFGNISWHEWDDDFKFRKQKALTRVGQLLSEEVDFYKFLQFLFFRQWFRLKEYANSKNIQLIGDVPLYVSGESADVWANTDIFLLGENLQAIEVAGVPPDYFSETGQLWGNPVFNWQRLKARDYDWWMARLHFNLNFFNLVRIDHFRGLESYWSVPANEKTAINGKWVPAFGNEMLAKLKSQINSLPLIAEDLGIITPEVDKLRENFELPGMKVLQFAFVTDASNKDLPHNFARNFVAYTGTHDNNTTLGWLNSVKGDEKKRAQSYLGKDPKEMLGNAIEIIWASVAERAIISMQDLLGLDSDARMNTPGTTTGNWGWRFQWEQLKVGQKKILKELTEKYNR